MNPTTPIDVLARFVSTFKPVLESDECWNWPGSKTALGYGVVNLHKKSFYAHRLSFDLFVHPLTSGLVICHRCDNPRCMRPSHLFSGTQKDNLSDMARKGRSTQGQRQWNAKLDPEAIRAIRESAERNSVLAERYGVCPQTISKIKIGRRWAWMQS